MQITAIKVRCLCADFLKSRGLLRACEGQPAVSRTLTKITLVMRLTSVILISTFLNVHAEGISQNITITGRNIPLKEVFSMVEKQTGYTVFGNSDLLRKTRPVSTSVRDMPLVRFLDFILKDQPLNYRIAEKTIILSERVAQAKPAALAERNDEKPNMEIPFVDISGSLVNVETGEPIVAASITVKGTSTGTTSGISGAFSLSGVADNAVLVISSVGFEDLEISVGTLRALSSGAIRELAAGTVRKTESGSFVFQLKPSSSVMDDVVIIPYGTTTRSKYTGAAVTVTSKELEGRPRTSFQESLQGNVPGLQSTTGTGQPGAAGNIRIRGTGSINANASPLYVVDGVPMNDMVPTVLAFSSNPLAAINPNDIESVTVLKDAAATSIYGSRAANGVIMITTKSGSIGRTKINATAQAGYTEMIINDKNRSLNTQEMTELLIEGVINSQSSALAGITTPEDAYNYLLTQGLKPDINTDWYDVITQRGKFRQYDVSASGGTAKNTFFASAGYYQQDAVTKGQDYERLSARLRMKNTSLERLSINVGMAPSFQKLSTIGNAGLGANPIRSLNRLTPWTRPYNDDGSYSAITYNPEIVRKENIYDTRIYSLLGDIGAEFKILKNLSVETKAAIDMSYADDFRYWSPLWVDAATVRGRGAKYSTTMVSWNITNLLKYNARITDRLDFDATLGQEAQKKVRQRVSTQAEGYGRDDQYTLANAPNPYVAWGDEAVTSLLSFFMNTSLRLDSRFVLNLTGRIDGSSMFGKKVRYAKFGSVGLSWNMHEEDFMKAYHFIDELRLRTSYGINGNLYNAWYGFDGLYTTTGTYNEAAAYILRQKENDRLTWEKNKPFDIGIDFSLFRGRISGSFDYYKRFTSDLLLYAGTSATNGVDGQNKNVGSLENHGIELALTSKNIVSDRPEGFNWSTGFNISTGKNVIISLGGVSNMVEGVFNREIGGDYFQYYMKEWAGADPETGGGLWYRDVDKKTLTNNYDSAVALNQGIARPKSYGGFTNTVDYKRFTLSFMLYYHWGGQVFDNWGAYTSSDGSVGVSDYGAISRVDYDNRWQKPGDIAFSPKVVYGGSQTGSSSQTSSRFLYDASYIRLRDVTLSYQLPANKITQNARVYLRANNLFTYVKDDRLRQDPETFVGGVLNQNLPIARQLLIGLDVTL